MRWRSDRTQADETQGFLHTAASPFSLACARRLQWNAVFAPVIVEYDPEQVPMPFDRSHGPPPSPLRLKEGSTVLKPRRNHAGATLSPICPQEGRLETKEALRDTP